MSQENGILIYTGDIIFEKPCLQKKYEREKIV
jgi:hypothetical protein